uniref:DNA 5'-3' helicase n=1 Tax=Dipterosiphonia australica TaxID=2007208 RepID=A0A1Z1MMD1_9FLOR|nr:Replication helicase subunit [Dipterosiphonia australica]ARW66911.1 Replication helicase subunit [Dipterosiphonia australica]
MNDIYNHKFVPHNYIAEETLIGIILIYPNIFRTVKNIIRKEYFFLEVNQIIYINLIHSNNKENIFELLYKLQNKKLLSRIGGIQKIIRVMKQGQIFISSSQANYYLENLIKLLHNNYLRRLIIQLGYNIINIGHIESINTNNIYSKILSYLYLIDSQLNKNNNNKIVDIKDLISKKLIQIKHKNSDINTKIKKLSIQSGFFGLDQIINSLPEGNLIIIAGRPSIGKTSLAINIAYNIFFYQNKGLLIFSLEMSKEEIFNKLISIGSKTDINATKMQQLNELQWKKISNICKVLLKRNIYINDKSNIDIKYINQIARKLKKKNSYINLVVIDYLQLIDFFSGKQQKYSRSQELGYITRKLKLLAQFLKIPIIVISQLNRNIEIRNNKEPLLSDLKESGCIKSQNNINIKSKYTRHINIKSIHKSDKKINFGKLYNTKSQLPKILQSIQKTISVISYINISNKYTFNYTSQSFILFFTHNHKYLSYNVWAECNKILISTTVSNIDSNKLNCIYKNYLNRIVFHNYSKTYDINHNNYFNIISNYTITHNSIEQDADIILILYEKLGKEMSINLHNKKVIDLKISKNRNGNIGTCQLIFTPELSIFQNID